MDSAKKRKLQRAGWEVGTAADFLKLTPEEAAFVELKLALSNELRVRRKDRGLSQVELARKLGSSQSRVARMEASEPSVSIDLLIHALLAIGASRREIATAIGRTGRQRSSKGHRRRAG